MQLDALVAAGVQKRDVFADVTSGSKTGIERRGMKKLLEYAESGDTVVVWRVDRLGRSLIDVLNTVNLLRERGVHVRSISDGIDPATSTGRLMLNMLATLAEYERELIDVVDQTVRQCEVGELVQTIVPLPSVDDTLRKAEATASYVQRLAEARELLMVEVQTSSEVFKQLTKQAFGRFDSIQKALASTGVDTRAPQDLREHLDNQGLHLELALVLREINWRLRELEREMTVRVERAAPTELERLARVVAHIRGTQDGTAQPATADALG